MIRKKNTLLKPLHKVEISVTEILIAGDGALKPYIQTFHYEPENVILAPLGSIFGIFEIEDQSEDSAYIVNFLASVVKKEYFLHHKRAAIESLEATLHKVNLALSELIKQDNTAWLGKLNATLCVFEKNNIHFSVSGKAKTLLIRNGLLSDISDGLAEESNIHPLKTFTEVSSGRLKSNDKVILTTPGLFEIFSPEELQKNAERFSYEKFSQFLKTALVNQLLFGGTLVIDIFEANFKKSILKKSVPATAESQSIPNVFSQSAFSNKTPITQNTDNTPEPHLPENIPSQDTNYTDSKTGHIYVQGDIPRSHPNETWLRIQWVIEDAFGKIIHVIKQTFVRYLKNTQAYFSKKYVATHFDTTTPTPPEQETPRVNLLMRSLSALPLYLRAFKSFLPRVIPRFSIIKSEFLKLTAKQKQYAVAAIFLIFIVPFLIVKFQDKQKPTNAPVEEKTLEKTSPPLSQDKNIHIISSAQSILSNSNAVTIILLKDTPFAITKNSVINLKDPHNTQAFPLPEAFGANIVHAAAMNDLNTIFLLTDTKKVIAFTPSNRSFTENSISLITTSDMTGIATYLTYLYVLDSTNNTIYRYPRATGGFGEGLPWLKESIEIQGTDTMAINEDLYLSQSDHLLAFNKGKKDPIAFEKSTTPIVFSYVFTQANTSFLYVLDTVNGRLIQFEKSGAIINQYMHENLKKALSITVDEQRKRAYFTTPSEVFSMELK